MAAKTNKILIVEDDETIRVELQNLLQGNGYDPAVISDFGNTVQTVKAWQPHLILLDIKLPDENGFTLCSKIRTFSTVPVIFVTSCNTDMDELNSIMTGGAAHLAWSGTSSGEQHDCLWQPSRGIDEE